LTEESRYSLLDSRLFGELRTLENAPRLSAVLAKEHVDHANVAKDEMVVTMDCVYPVRVIA
jgi:hypothetical protein